MEVLDSLEFRKCLDKKCDRTTSEKNIDELAFIVSCFKDDIEKREKYYLYFRPSKKLAKSVFFDEFLSNLKEDDKDDNMKMYQVEKIHDYYFMYKTNMKSVFNVDSTDEEQEQEFLKTVNVLLSLNKKIPIVDLYKNGERKRLYTPTPIEIKNTIIEMRKDKR